MIKFYLKMNKNREFEIDFSNIHNSYSNNISDLNDINNDIPSSCNESIKNNFMNNISNNRKRSKKKSYINNLANNIFYKEDLLNSILNYLNISELIIFRVLNHNLLNLVYKYLKIRFDFEIKSLISFQNKNEKLIVSYMNNINEQIPMTKGNWLDLNLDKNLSNFNLLTQELILKIIKIKDEVEIPDIIYKSVLIIIGFNNKDIIDNENINLKKVFNSILINPNMKNVIQNIDYENIDDIEVMKILNEFNKINLPNFNKDISQLIIWIQSVISFHILIHPYIYRNNKSNIKPQSKEYYFANEMEKKIEKFYKLKRFLLYLGIININIGDYVFTIQHTNASEKKDNNNRITEKKYKKCFSYNKIINDSKIIGNILSYIPFKESYKIRNASKSFLNGFKHSIDIILFSIIKEVYFFRFQYYDDYILEIPIIFSHNIFSKFFLMLDEILNEPLSKNELITSEIIQEIKKLKSKNENIIKIAKIFCEITNIKIYKNQDGKKDFMYTLRMMALQGNLLKKMKNCNKLYFSQKKINIIYNDLKEFCDLKKLNRIKYINRSIYHILIWEMLFLEYLRFYNIFDFVNFEVNNDDNNDNNNKFEFVENFLKMMDYLRYILNIRFHFFVTKKNNKKKETSYGFKESIDKLKKYLIELNITYKKDLILSSSIENFESIGNLYFNNVINKKNILAFYENIIREIICFYNESKINYDDDVDYEELKNIYKEKRKSKNTFSIVSLDSMIDDNDNDNMLIDQKKSNNNNYNTIYSQRLPASGNTIQSFKEKNSFKNKTFYSSKENSNIHKRILKTKIYDIPNDIFIKTIFLYIDIHSLSRFAFSNKKFLYCFKIHMHIRLNFINKKKIFIEENKQDIINSINNKRTKFYTKYKIIEPNKEHATKLINKLKIKDIKDLKQYFKNYNKIYITIITPFLLLLNNNNNNDEFISNFKTVKKILYSFNGDSLINKINSLEIELISNDIINKVNELLIKNECFRPEYMKRFNNCFKNVISWCIGILEFYKLLRKYSVVNNYDLEVLKQKEIIFCNEYDSIILIYYKVFRYINYFSEEYEKEAKDIINQMII